MVGVQQMAALPYQRPTAERHEQPLVRIQDDRVRTLYPSQYLLSLPGEGEGCPVGPVHVQP